MNKDRWAAIAGWLIIVVYIILLFGIFLNAHWTVGVFALLTSLFMLAIGFRTESLKEAITKFIDNHNYTQNDSRKKTGSN